MGEDLKRPQSFYDPDETEKESPKPYFFEEEAEEEEEEEEVEEGTDDASDAEETEEADDSKDEEETDEETAEEEESDTSEQQEKLYEFAGRKMTADELAQAAIEIQKDHTKKSQELAELKKGKEEPAKKEAAKYSEEDKKLVEQFGEILINDPELREKFGIVTKTELAEKEELAQIDKTFKDLESKYSGEDGLPKFEIGKVIEFMQANNYPPHLAERAYKDMYEKDIISHTAQKLVKNKGGYETEANKAPAKKVEHKGNLNSREDVEDYVLGELSRMGADL